MSAAGITKPLIDRLKSPQYLFAGRVAEGYGFEPLAEDIFQRQQVPVAFGTGEQGSQHIHTPDLERGAGLDGYECPSVPGSSGSSLDKRDSVVEPCGLLAPTGT